MAAIEDKIAALETKLKQAKTIKKQIEARQRATEAKVKRSLDTRRKILAGSIVLAKVERGEWKKDKIWAAFDAALTRPEDRALFDLPPKDSTPPE
jgi:phage shock protein A